MPHYHHIFLAALAFSAAMSSCQLIDKASGSDSASSAASSATSSSSTVLEKSAAKPYAEEWKADIKGLWEQDERVTTVIDGAHDYRYRAKVNFVSPQTCSLTYSFVYTQPLTSSNYYNVEGEVSYNAVWERDEKARTLTIIPDVESLVVKAERLDMEHVTDSEVRNDINRTRSDVLTESADDLKRIISKQLSSQIVWTDVKVSSTSMTFVNPLGEFIRLVKK